MRYVLFCLSLVLMEVTACAAADYVPLAVGQETIMSFSLERKDGQVVHDTFHLRVEGTVEKQGKTYYRCRSWLESNRLNEDPIKLMRKDSNSVHTLAPGVSDSTEFVEFVLPFKAGASWQQTVAGKKYETAVIGRESIKADGVTYADCYHLLVSRDNGNFKDDLWIAPNIGTVKSISLLQNGSRLTYTIKEFKPGK